MAGSVTIHGAPFSPYSQRVAIILSECGVEDWKLVFVNRMKGENRLPAFLELNPFGKAPVYQDDDITLYESRTICRYLLEKFPEKGEELLGRDIKERADVNRWIDVEANTLSPALFQVLQEALFKKLFMKQEPDKAVVEQRTQSLVEILDVYEKHLQNHEFLAAGRLTFADLTHLPATALLEPAGLWDLITSRPHIDKWWKKVSARPSWVKVLEGPNIAKMVAASVPAP